MPKCSSSKEPLECHLRRVFEHDDISVADFAMAEDTVGGYEADVKFFLTKDSYEQFFDVASDLIY